jgi:tetratricopeptide (TPR) repeat protein
VNKKLLLICMAAALSLMVGCAGPTQELPPVVDSEYPETDLPQPYPGGEPAPDLETGMPLPPEQAPAPVPSTSTAVTSLVNQARAQYNTRDYQSAIATAERGLRIDRRSAELYLILAQSYVQLAMPEKAGQFVQQGLRFAPSGSPVAESLRRVQGVLSGS